MTNIPRVKIYQFHISPDRPTGHKGTKPMILVPNIRLDFRLFLSSGRVQRLVNRASHAIRTSTQKSHLMHVRAACPPYGRFLCSCCYTCSEPFHSQELRITFHRLIKTFHVTYILKYLVIIMLLTPESD